MIIDSHCHLISSRYEKPIHEIIDICEASNISLLLNIATKEKEFNEILSLSNKYKQIYNSVGIQPHETENLNKDIFIKIDDIIKNIAIFIHPIMPDVSIKILQIMGISETKLLFENMKAINLHGNKLSRVNHLFNRIQS